MPIPFWRTSQQAALAAAFRARALALRRQRALAWQPRRQQPVIPLRNWQRGVRPPAMPVIRLRNWRRGARP